MFTVRAKVKREALEGIDQMVRKVEKSVMKHDTEIYLESDDSEKGEGEEEGIEEKIPSDVNIFDRTKVRESENVNELSGPLFKTEDNILNRADPESEVIKTYHQNEYFKEFSDRYEAKVKSLARKLEEKEEFAFSRNLLNFTNKSNVYRPSGAAYAVAKNALLSNLTSRKEKNLQRYQTANEMPRSMRREQPRREILNISTPLS